MNTHPVEWNSDNTSGLTAILPVAAEETRRRIVIFSIIFAVISVIGLIVGIALPKKYSSWTTVLVEERNIIAPLMEGRAVTTDVVNRAGIAKEVAFSRKVMQEILEAGGWMAEKRDAVEQEKLIEQIKAKTVIGNPRENLIQIVYTDSDPDRAYEVTKRFGDLVIEESLATKERESREAYEFIDSQVDAYHDKLTEAEANLEKFRNSTPDSQPGVATDVLARIGELRRQIESAKMDLIELRSQEGAITSQLSGENEVSLVQTRAGQLRARMGELLSERERLMLAYTDQHPDVIRVQHQIDDLQQQLLSEQSRETASTIAGSSLGNSVSTFNPLYAELKSKLSDVRRRSAAASSRIAQSEQIMRQELDRGKRIASSENQLAELTRDYEVNRDLYQDLLKRRENARVSMNLDAERRGLSFRIQEPANKPLRPSGLRLMHVAGASLAVAVASPILLLIVFIKLDPRIRSAHQIEKLAGLPVLGSVPTYKTPKRRRENFRRMTFASLVIMLVPLIYALALVLKWVRFV